MAKTKATSTPNYGFNPIDCAQDPNMLFQDYVRKDGKENWEKADSVIKAIDDRVTQLENEPSSNVLFNGEVQSNFNFIENKVVQNNLECLDVNTNKKNYDTDFFVDFDTTMTICSTFDMGTYVNNQVGYYLLGNVSTSPDNGFYFGNTSPSDRDKMYFYVNNMGVESKIELKTKPKNNYLKVVLKDRVFKVTLNGVTKTINYVCGELNKNLFLKGYGYSGSDNGLIVKYITVYSRVLAPNEEYHNFSVLNNNSSINSFSIQDNDNNIKEYSFSTDENHVEMSTGRTLHDEYMGVLKTMGEEFISEDGSDIIVENGLEARVISGEIKGRTLKSIANVDSNYKTSVGDGSLKPNYQVVDTYNLVKPNQDYTLVTEVTKNTLNGEGMKLVNTNTACMFNPIPDLVEPRQTGLFIKKIRSKSNLEGATQIIRHSMNADNTEGEIVFRTCVFEGDVVDIVKGFSPFGLTSTQAIIANNNQDFTIYEPTMQGKKVISLGGVGGVCDTLEIKDDGSGLWTQNTKEITFTGQEAWSFEVDTMVYNLKTLTDLKYGTNTINVISDKLTGVTPTEGYSTVNSVFSASTAPYLRVNCGVVNETLQNFRVFVAGIKVRYQISTPIITHIPKELIPAILTHNQTNMLSAGGVVKTSSFKVTVPTTDGIKKVYDLTPINGWKGTAKANLLQTGDVELVLDLTIPSSFNASVCSLATELRPKAERTVLGYNGNTPVVVKIGTDGTVKLPVTATGTVKLDDTYKL